MIFFKFLISVVSKNEYIPFIVMHLKTKTIVNIHLIPHVGEFVNEKLGTTLSQFKFPEP